jgi:hypothetical protein
VAITHVRVIDRAGAQPQPDITVEGSAHVDLGRRDAVHARTASIPPGLIPTRRRLNMGSSRINPLPPMEPVDHRGDSSIGPGTAIRFLLASRW